MAIEKVFAIEAPPEQIWDALWQELSRANPDGFEVEQANRPNMLMLRLDVAGLDSVLIYRIQPAEGYSEVAAELVPLSLRYRLYQVVTFGHMRRNYEMLLAAGLANLKAALEPQAPQPEGEEA